MQRFLDGRDGKELRDLARAGRFELALRAFERRRYRDAERLFGETVREAASPMDRARGHYWAGRAAEARKRTADASASYREALAPEPLGWYALLARGRLRALGADPGAPFDAASSARAVPVATPAPAPALPEEAAFYARLGLREDAVAALRGAESRCGKDEAGSAALVAAYHALGEHARPHALVSERDALLRRPPAPDNAWAWAAAYARPHAAVVEAAAAQAGIDPALVHAVMRKESGFDPDVVSYADAIGLMQLLPETAAKVAAERGDAYRREALFEPETNVRWGAHLLGGLAREHGEPVLALAAYNAGSHRVEPWLAREGKRGRIETDHFVERIPITQTRNYVRRVVGNWARYAYLADPARGWPFELPAQLPSSALRRR
jgi:soluble lytic murein transglycosylase